MTKDTSREAAVVALREALMLVHREPPEPWTFGNLSQSLLDAILANPAHRKALVAVLLPVEELAAAIHRWHNPGTVTPCRPESNCHLTAAAIHRNLSLTEGSGT